MPPSIPTEHELIKVGLQVFAPEAMIDAQTKPLEVRERTMNPRHQDMRCHLTDHARSNFTVRSCGISRISIGPDYERERRRASRAVNQLGFFNFVLHAL